MNLAMNQEHENRDTQNIVPLGSDEIKSILKSQSESVFEDKNISNNSNFVKKSLIDIALDFESKQNIKENEIIDGEPENNKNLKEENYVPNDEQKSEEQTIVENTESDNINVIEYFQFHIFPVNHSHTWNRSNVSLSGDGSRFVFVELMFF